LCYIKKHSIYITHNGEQKTLSKIMMFQAKRTGETQCYGSCYNSADTFEGAVRDSEKVQSK